MIDFPILVYAAYLVIAGITATKLERERKDYSDNGIICASMLWFVYWPAKAIKKKVKQNGMG